MVVSNSYWGVFCFVCLRLVYGGVQQLLWCVFYCWTPPYTGRRQTKQSTHHNSCWTPPYIRRRQTKQNTHHKAVSNSYCVVCFVLFAFVLCMMVSNSYCGVCFVSLRLVYGDVQQLLWCVLCFVCLCLMYGGVQHILCCVFCLFV
jgi:hypothetical protein